MIVSFSIENWMSFCDPVSFSMVASREKQHGDRVPKVEKYQTRILPIAAIYGANASGKTNFFKALNFIKNLVVRGTEPDSLILVEPYRLDSRCLEKPSRFKLELLINEIIYEFSFAATGKSVIEEKLVQITSTSEKTLYDRQGGNPNFHSSLDKDQFLHFAFKGTRDNQLFLTNSVSQKVNDFKPVHDWFKNTLHMVAPDSIFGRFGYFLDKEHPLHDKMNELLPQLDTGISHLSGEEVPFDSIPFKESFKNKLREDIKEGKLLGIFSRPTNERFILTRSAGKLTAKKLVAFHPKADGTEAKFEIHQESDGSQRVIELLPAFFAEHAAGSKTVHVIDEVDRSLHTLLTRKLLETYLANCGPESRAQLLITTHDVLLMDQELLRRDEMWVTERNSKGSSDIFSFNDYKDIRYDKDIRKSYLQGRLGGVPRILLDNILINREDNN